MEERVFNFSAGPSQMPNEVLLQAQKDMYIYPGAGCSVMEMSHRSAAFQDIISSAEADLRTLMNIPDEYSVLFLQGGASLQFSMVPMNLAHQGDTFAYIQSGNFASKAKEEGDRWGNAVFVSSSKEDGYKYIPYNVNLPENAKFLHFTGNNTIFGTSFNKIPEHGNVPLVADWSSAILGKVVNIKDYDLVYAGAQKNMGPAGLTVVIIKKKLLEFDVDTVVPTMLRYKVAADNGSMYNTPPCYSIYMAGLMFKWLLEKGGVEAMEATNKEKAKLLYDYIDNSDAYYNDVNKEDRSITNVCFKMTDDSKTAEFVNFAKERGLINLKGHRIAGGLRASIYNGMPVEGVNKLIDTMKAFEKNL